MFFFINLTTRVSWTLYRERKLHQRYLQRDNMMYDGREEVAIEIDLAAAHNIARASVVCVCRNIDAHEHVGRRSRATAETRTLKETYACRYTAIAVYTVLRKYQTRLRHHIM